jgi:hypothetical protein
MPQMTTRLWFKTPSGARSLLACLIAPFLALPSVAQTQKPIFPTLPHNFALLPQPNMALGDFNGDGRIDEAVPGGINTMAVMLNNGPSSAASVTSISLSCTPQFVLASDLNNDSKVDLAFSCQGGYVGVLLGNGDGTFQSASYYAVAEPGGIATPPTLTQLIAVDLNGDGYLDIAVVVDYDKVGVLLNQGSGKPGSLSPPVLYPAPASVRLSNISAGDFNGDGKQDILAGSTQLAVYYGKGDGTLNSPQLTTANTAATLTNPSFVTGDFNRDGLADVAYLAANTISGVQTSALSLQILLGDPSGTFTTGATLALNPSANYTQIVPFQNTTTSNVSNFALVGDVTSIALNDGNGGLSLGESYGVSSFAVALAGSNGNTNLYFQRNVESVTAVGNGNGTFQAPPATVLGLSEVTADLNHDGLTDVLALDASGNLLAALGRGNGTFNVVSRTPGTGQLFATGDFNGDGNTDVVSIFPGQIYYHDANPEYQISSAQLYFYSGNGDGTFQPLPAVDLGLSMAGIPLVGDFNSDGKLDLILPYYGFLGASQQSGSLFFAGNGDGTFAAPVAVSILPSPASIGQVLDINNDGKLDVLNGNTVYLGNGDGTFNQQPFPFSGTVSNDLNGDGKADLVAVSGNTISFYAGNGDGTFQTNPFYTTSLPQNASGIDLSVGDVNADGHPDLIIQYFIQNYTTLNPTSTLAVYFGDGAGNFSADTNTYSVTDGIGGQLVRLNNQAPNPPGDNALDYLNFKGPAVISLINQLNPAPVAPTPLASKTTLAVSASRAAPGQQLTLTATVTGAAPTGTVSFVAEGKALGSAPLINGTATRATSFATASTYPVIANYPGDANNAPSSSNAVSIVVAPVSSTTTLSVSAASAGTNQQLTLTASVSGLNPTGTVSFASAGGTLGTASVANGVATLSFTFTAVGSYAITASYAGDVDNTSSTSTAVTVVIAAPDYTITASPSSATIKAGQSATTTLTVTPIGGYNGTVKFSCGTLPTGVNCTFAPASVTPTSGVVTSTLTITTTAPTTALLRTLSLPLQGIAWASLLFLTLSPRKLRGLNRRLTRASLLIVFLAVGLLSFSGCSSSSPSNPPTNTGTPAGVQTITLTTTDSSGNLSHAINFQVTVQ